MSFKFHFLIFFVVILAFGCGVKSRPVSPAETAVPSYVKSFLDQDDEKNSETKPKTPAQ